MKKKLILLAVIAAFSSCRKSSGTNNSVSCWQCAIEGSFNGKIVDVDSMVCDKTQTQINEFMAPYNTTQQVVTCSRITSK